jgi:hypothetical protein
MVGAEIRRLMEVGGLTVADMAHWLDEPRSTVAGWANKDVEPMKFKHADLWRKLQVLSKIIAKNRGYAIPDHIGMRDRIAYIKKIRVL